MNHSILEKSVGTSAVFPNYCICAIACVRLSEMRTNWIMYATSILKC